MASVRSTGPGPSGVAELTVACASGYPSPPRISAAWDRRTSFRRGVYGRPTVSRSRRASGSRASGGGSPATLSRRTR